MPYLFPIVSKLARRGALIALALWGPMALAQVELKLSKTTLMSGSHCQLTAIRTDQRVPHWVWGPPEAAIITHPDGRVFFTAPAVTEPTWFTILVTDTAADPPCALCREVHVLPFIPGMPPELAEDLMVEWTGRPDWMGVPGMTLFAGGAGTRLDESQPAPFENISSFRLLEDDPAMGALNDRWLVGDSSGLHVLARDGGGRPVRRVHPGAVLTLAVRPRGSLPGSPHHVAFVSNRGGCKVVQVLAPDGSARVLAGAEDPAHGRRLRYADGLGSRARFGWISALEMGPDGTLFVADLDNGRIRRIDPAGLVTTFAGGAHVELFRHLDGPATQAAFYRLGGMALDPVRGDLYVIDGNSVCRVSPAGEVTTILGDAMRPGVDPRPADNVVPLGMRCLWGPSEIRIHGRHLFITDTEADCVRVFHLDTRIMLDLTVPHAARPGMGPLPCFNPSLPAEACAALSRPRHLAVTPDGVCLVGLPSGLARLDVRDLTHAAEASEAKAETQGEAKTEPH